MKLMVMLLLSGAPEYSHLISVSPSTDSSAVAVAVFAIFSYYRQTKCAASACTCTQFPLYLVGQCVDK